MFDGDDIISPAFDVSIRKTLVAQVIVGILAALMLDGGVIARVVGLAILVFWLSALVIIGRRPHQPTKLDLAVIRWGFWPILVVALMRQGDS